MKKGLGKLRNHFPLATINSVDIFSALYPLYANPAKYGKPKLRFEQPLVTCCGYGGKYNYNAAAGCGQTVNVNGTNIVVGSCKDPSVRVDWDGSHFTEVANKFVFDQISNGTFSDPPIPLKMACHPTQLHS
ncbi:hypothetical protein COLO4_35917 [Corchorus olitorius]|uniref:Lipase, GDSL n=1 Tax=Corchorus olitorius TaxID=93759 RepID=A0A1R3GBY9_9ROSI|nr:hypothetical protein COLO4_35917 [Corchorus olitorius]